MGYHQNSSLISEEKSIARAFGNFGFNLKWEERGGKGGDLDPRFKHRMYPV